MTLTVPGTVIVTTSVTSAVKCTSSSAQVWTCGTVICTVMTFPELVGDGVMPTMAARTIVGISIVCVDVCKLEYDTLVVTALAPWAKTAGWESH
jgi:hypothetical protein